MRFNVLWGAVAVVVLGAVGCSDGSQTCGDGVVQGFEECDDGNSDDLDGCSNDCREWTPPSGDPVGVSEDFTWEWIPVGGALCRDGSPAGFGVSFNSASDNVMIYLEGGGACFDSVTCTANPSSFDSSSFDGKSGGVFDRDHPDNPVADWNFVYVPYCTGDVHAGLAEEVEVDGVDGRQQFVGYRNVGLFLERIVPTFPEAEAVLLTGVSAGGFGAAANAEQVQRDFGDVPVILLDDSGPPMSSEFITPCLQEQWRERWGLDRTMLADCQWDCPNENDFVLDFADHLVRTYPDNMGGMFSHLSDAVIRFFFGFGGNECQYGIAPPPMPEDEFQMGLRDFRSFIQSSSDNFGTYYTEGDTHTCIGGGCFYDTEVNGTPLTQWVGDLIVGQTSHVAP